MEPFDQDKEEQEQEEPEEEKEGLNQSNCSQERVRSHAERD